MILAAYQADVECRGTFGPRGSCSTIMDDMETTRESETFAPSDDPAAQIPLPVVMKASKQRFHTFFSSFWRIAYTGGL